MTIWKWTLAITDIQEIDAPRETRFLHVDVQNGELTLWGWCDPDNYTEDRVVAIVGTGNPAPTFSEARHLGSAIMPNGLVWHVFEPKEEA